ncbi:diguanylate cyclase domain-containing protein [Herbaspirillum sp. GCM10030257]|uniref:diguanylate cyclase domain-containing protein n=1 Tax=Herbaspirillum sp. GCM10030257 TaxID=3273393 RepID=UPI00361B3026
MKFRLVALGAGLVMIGVIVRFFIALPMFQANVQELVATQQLSIASYVARDIDHSITSRLELINQFASELPSELASQPDALQTWVKDRQQINPLFNGGLVVVRPDGRGLYAEYPRVTGRSQLDYATSDWFMSALRSSKPVIGRPTRGRASGDPIIIFAAPVRDTGGSVVAVLAGVALLNTPGFLDLMQESQLGATGGFLLISPADQLFIASSDPAMILAPTPPPGVNHLHDRAMAGYRGTGVTINAKGREELSAIVTVPSTGWFMVAHIPTKEAFRPVEELRKFMFKTSAIFLVLIMTVLLIALPRILRPLTDAARAIRDMADGKVRLTPLPVVRDDEVGQLLQGFNFLVHRLRAEESAREATEERLKFLAHHDSLTGLYNRTMLEEHLELALGAMRRDGSQIALLFCDLDDFKGINDNYGHTTGDAVLREVARRLTEGRRRVDTVARLGGDEFVILVTGLSDARTAANLIAEQCLTAISEPFEIDGKIFELGMSIGIATHAGSAVTSSYLIAQADIAMYQAKRRGKEGLFFMGSIHASGPKEQPAMDTGA